MLEYLQMLADVGLTTKLREEIRSLHTPNKTEQFTNLALQLTLNPQTVLADLFNEFATEASDDYEQIFGGLVNKMLHLAFLCLF